MLREEMARYTELSGNDGEHTAIGIIGAYLDGYEKGLESRESIHGHWKRRTYIGNHKTVTMYVCSECDTEFGWDIETGISMNDNNFCPNCGADMRGKTE